MDWREYIQEKPVFAPPPLGMGAVVQLMKSRPGAVDPEAAAEIRELKPRQWKHKPSINSMTWDQFRAFLQTGVR